MDPYAFRFRECDHSVIIGARRGRNGEPVEGLAPAHSVEHVSEERSAADKPHRLPRQPAGAHPDLDDRDYR
jgi:hypothetical protein